MFLEADEGFVTLEDIAARPRAFFVLCASLQASRTKTDSSP